MSVKPRRMSRGGGADMGWFNRKPEPEPTAYRCDMGWSDESGAQFGCRNDATTQFGLASLCDPCAQDHEDIASRRQRGE